MGSHRSHTIAFFVVAAALLFLPCLPARAATPSGSHDRPEIIEDVNVQSMSREDRQKALAPPVNPTRPAVVPGGTATPTGGKTAFSNLGKNQGGETISVTDVEEVSPEPQESPGPSEVEGSTVGETGIL